MKVENPLFPFFKNQPRSHDVVLANLKKVEADELAQISETAEAIAEQSVNSQLTGTGSHRR